jgi:hypothetical protein
MKFLAKIEILNGYFLILQGKRDSLREWRGCFNMICGGNNNLSAHSTTSRRHLIMDASPFPKGIPFGETTNNT